MILLKSILNTRRTILVVSKKYQILSSSSFHQFQPITASKLTAVHPFLLPEFCGISRFESTQTASGKDVILEVPVESRTNELPAQGVDLSVAGDDGLPDIQAAADVLPEILPEVILSLNKLGEVPLQSLGLGSPFTPVGWIQRVIEYLHVTFEIPWWSSIAICVAVARLLIFPLVIKQQRSSVKLHNVMPEMTALQTKMQNAKTYGNHVEMMKAGQDLSRFMQENKVSPFGSLILPMVQAPIFLSFFLALKKMAAVPVESLKDGGMLWFVDLTVADQLYALPAITCVTLWLTLELGADFTKMPSATMTGRYMPYFLRAVPVIVFPFMINFPTVICVYWASSNFISLTQVAFLKIPAVRTYFKIEPKKPLDKSAAKGQRKGIVTDVKSSIANMRVAKEIEERERLDEMNFKRAGRQPPAKTFKHNPLLTSQAIQAKKQ